MLLNNALSSDLLYLVCSSITAGKVPTTIVPLLSASRLVALPKTNGGIRPIAIGECLRRVTAGSICSQYCERFMTYFSSLQHKVAAPGGAELICHHIQLLIEQYPTLSVIKTGVSNAFVSISRYHLIHEVAFQFLELLNHVFQMYGNTSSLVYEMGDGSAVNIASEDGVHQGNPLWLLSYLLSAFIQV